MNADKFIGWLTAIVTLLYVGASAYAFARSEIDFPTFSGAVGPIVGTLVGYFIRGSKA